MVTCLGAAYPLVAHAAVAVQSTVLTVAAVALLALLLLGPGLMRGRPIAWLVVVIIIGGLVWKPHVDVVAAALYLPPIVINVALALLFGHTLRAGRTSLLERLVRLMHAPGEQLDPAIPLYTRRLTRAWAVLFAVLAIVNLALALCATPGGLLSLAGATPPLTVPREAWSTFANLLNYVIVAAFFLGEYAYRRRRFPQQPYTSVVDFVTRAARVGPQLLDRPPLAPRADVPSSR